MSTKLDAATIARLSLHDPTDFGIQHTQTLHRLELLQHWNVSSGSKVLELGCGQGDCTTVLANAVGEQGAVVAVDPAELTYGVFFSCDSLLVWVELTLQQAPRIPLVKRRITSRKDC